MLCPCVPSSLCTDMSPLSPVEMTTAKLRRHPHYTFAPLQLVTPLLHTLLNRSHNSQVDTAPPTTARTISAHPCHFYRLLQVILKERQWSSTLPDHSSNSWTLSSRAISRTSSYSDTPFYPLFTSLTVMHCTLLLSFVVILALDFVRN